MRTVLIWFAVALVGSAILSARARGQDIADQDSWNVATGNWGNDDNWVDEFGELSATPSVDDDRWALIDNNGTATVTDSQRTSGLTVGSGTVEILAGGSLEVALQEDAFSVGQTQIGSLGTLGIQGDGSYQGINANIQGTLNLSQAATFELSGNANLLGTLTFEVNQTGNGSVSVGGDTTIAGTIAPVFDGVSPAFGQTITFVEAGSVNLASPTLELPEGVSLPRGLKANIVANGGNASITFESQPILRVDRGTSTGEIMNVVGGPVEMTGYVIESELGLLDPAGFDGFGGASWDRPDPINTALVEFNLIATRSLEVNDSLSIGEIYNVGATLPEDEDVTFKYFTPNGEIREGLVEYTGPANDLVLNVNPQTGEVTIQNLSPVIDPVEVTGYSVISESSSLIVDEWKSLENAGETGWLEANPESGFISEVNPSTATTFTNGTVHSLGNIFDVANGVQDLVLQYSTTREILFATVEYQLTDSEPPVTTLTADFNGDGTVSFPDFLTLSGQFNQPVDPPGSPPDLNGDGLVSFPDFLILSAQFGMSATAAAVPEPGGLYGLGLGAILLSGFRRRRTTSSKGASS